jgi:hypothetical protein
MESIGGFPKGMRGSLGIDEGFGLSCKLIWSHVDSSSLWRSGEFSNALNRLLIASLLPITLATYTLFW